MANRDLEFVLKFRNEAKAVLKQAQADLKALGQTAAQVGVQMRQFNQAQLSTTLALDKQAISAAKVETANARLAAQNARTAIETQRLGFAQQKLVLDEARLSFQTEKLAFQQEQLARAKNRAATSGRIFGAVAAQLYGVLAPLVGVYGAISAARLGDEFTVTSTNIKNATSSTKEYNRVFNDLFKIAQDTGASFSGLADGYVKLSISLSDNLRESTDLVKVNELLARGFAASGTSAQTAAGATLQLTQGLATNFKAAGQELNSIIEGAPLLAKAIAIQLGGKGAADLKKFAEEGKLTAKVFLEALIAAESQIEKFAIPSTVSRSFEKLRNEFLLITGQGQGFRAYLAALSGTMDFLREHLDAVLKVITVLSAVAIPALTVAIGVGLVGAIKALTAAALLNPFVALASALAGAAAALYIFRKEIKETAQDFMVWFVKGMGKGIISLAGIVQGSIAGMIRVIKGFFNAAEIELFKFTDGLAQTGIGKRLGLEAYDLGPDVLSKIKAAGQTAGQNFNDGFVEATEQHRAALAKLSHFGEMYGPGEQYGPFQEAAKGAGEYSETLSELTKEQQDFYKSLDEQIALLVEEAKWVGRSNKERERAVTLLKLQQDAIKAGIKDFDPTEFLAAYDALQDAKDRVHNDFGTGLKVAMSEFIENAKGAGDLAQDIFKGMADGISGTIRGLVDGSIKSFDDLRTGVADILFDLAGKIAEYLAIQNLVIPLAKSFGAPDSFISSVFSAKGNVFQNGQHLTAYAKGGILSSPAVFPTRSGMGVAGEAGPEGILPLKRMRNGVLGVVSDGGGGGNVQLNYSPTFSLNIEGGDGKNGPERGNMEQLLRVMDNETRKLVYEILDREQRPGGRLAGGR